MLHGPAEQPEGMLSSQIACLRMPHGPARQPKCILGSHIACHWVPHKRGNQPVSVQNANWAARLLAGQRMRTPWPTKQPECMLGRQIACRAMRAGQPHGWPRSHGSLIARMQIRHTIACWATLREARWLPGPTSTKHLTSHLDKQMLLSRHAPVANSLSTSLCRCISTGTH